MTYTGGHNWSDAVKRAHQERDVAIARVRELEAGLAEIAGQRPEHDGFFEDGCPCCIARATLWEPA